MKFTSPCAFLLIVFVTAVAAAPAAPATFDDTPSSTPVSGGRTTGVMSPPASETPTSVAQSSPVESSSPTSIVSSVRTSSPAEGSSSAPSSIHGSSSASSSVESSSSSAVVPTNSVTDSASAHTTADASTAPSAISRSSSVISSAEVTSATITPISSAISSSVEVTPPAESSSSATSSHSSSSTAPQPTSAPPSVNKQFYLDAHNDIRAQFGASPLTWSDELQAKAQGYAEQCQLKHSDGALGQVGENLAAATGFFGEQQAVALFTQDKDQFNKRNVVMSHFTQVVWKSTTQLGCGIAQCPGLFGRRKGTATYHVCLYDPVGNVVGEEKANLPIN